MDSAVFGRTNTVFPSVWLGLAVPSTPEDLDPLCRAALEAETVVDVSAQPALFGGYIRGTDRQLMTILGTTVENATDEKHASDLLQAELIQHLSAIGKMHFDFIFLNVRTPWEEFQINGALLALEAAREEGHLRFLGLFAGGSPLAALGFWQFRDAFEAVLYKHNPLQTEAFKILGNLADQRRVGKISCGALKWNKSSTFMPTLTSVEQEYDQLVQRSISLNLRSEKVLVGVRSASEVRNAIEASLPYRNPVDFTPEEVNAVSHSRENNFSQTRSRVNVN